MNELTDGEVGEFNIRTEASLYWVTLGPPDGLGENLLLRVPGQGLGAPDGDDPPTSTLRMDTRPITLTKIDKCVVGERAIFWVAMPADQVGVDNYAGTRRETTIVRSIERIA